MNYACWALEQIQGASCLRNSPYIYCTCAGKSAGTRVYIIQHIIVSLFSDVILSIAVVNQMR
jgi:hypothetical protein